MMVQVLRHARTASLACLALGAIALLPAATFAAEAEHEHGSRHEDMAAHFAQHIQEHLDSLSARLEIKASQQDAWQAFAGAFRETMTAQHETPSPTQADAASIVRERADRAAERAQTLARLADATAKLQQALGPEQRAVFNEVARHFAQHHPGPEMMMGHGEPGHYAMGPGGHHGGPDHCEGGDDHEGGPHGRHGAMGMPGDDKDAMPPH